MTAYFVGWVLAETCWGSWAAVRLTSPVDGAYADLALDVNSSGPLPCGVDGGLDAQPSTEAKQTRASESVQRQERHFSTGSEIAGPGRYAREPVGHGGDRDLMRLLST